MKHKVEHHVVFNYGKREGMEKERERDPVKTFRDYVLIVVCMFSTLCVMG